jgi:hypothetical protein
VTKQELGLSYPAVRYNMTDGPLGRCPLALPTHQLLLRYGTRALGLLVTTWALPGCGEPAEDWYVTAAYVVNTTRAPILTQIQRATQPLDCETVTSSAASTLRPEAFEFDSCPKLEPLAVLPLDQGWRRVCDGRVAQQDDYLGPPLDCEAVLLHSSETGTVLVYWAHRNKTDVVASYEPPPSGPGVFIERAGNRVFVSGAGGVSASPVSWSPSSESCPPASEVTRAP